MPVEVHVVDHPLIADSLTRVRDVTTPNALFRQELERIGNLLIAEATRGLQTHPVRVQTPLTETDGRVLTSQPVVVPVLRAGLVSGDSDSAVVLVAVDATVSNVKAPQGRPAHYRIKVDLAKEEGRWLVSKLEFVG